MKKILIIEDNDDIQNILTDFLTNNNYSVVSAYSGTEGMLLILKEKPNLILLDLMLPGLKGEEIIKKINDIPIIVISAKIDIEDKLNAFDLGAVDYITKPFEKSELLARIKACLKYKNKNVLETLKYLDLTLLNDGHTLTCNNNKVLLTKTEYVILYHLMQDPFRVISKNELLATIFDITPNCDESSLKVHISNIRKKLKIISNKEYIESIWGIGFKMKS